MTAEPNEIMIEGRARAIEEIVARYGKAEPAGEDADVFYMRAAVELAEVAARYGDVPVGCVIVRGGTIVAADCNGREVFHDALYMPEARRLAADGKHAVRDARAVSDVRGGDLVREGAQSRLRRKGREGGGGGIGAEHERVPAESQI